MTIKEYLKFSWLSRVAKGDILDARIAAALAERPLWELVEESQELLGKVWNKIIDSSPYRKLKWSCRKDTPYVLVYNDVAEYQSDDADCQITKEQLQKFLDGIRNDEWKSLSWLSNQPESREEKTVKVYPNGVVEYTEESSITSPLCFMLIPLKIWQKAEEIWEYVYVHAKRMSALNGSAALALHVIARPEGPRQSLEDFIGGAYD